VRLDGAFRDPWVWGQFTLAALLCGGLPWLAGQTPPGGPAGWLLHPGGPRWPGLFPLAAGLGFAAAGAAALGRNLTPATTPVADGAMIEAGAYRWVRHPIYTGVILALAGVCWLLTGWTAGLLALVVAWGYFDRKAAAEERKLVVRYPGYDAYRRRVPKLLPYRIPL
jgi:protein-S-isoprenylcysteine O-methyltransferase Ste14